MKIARISSNRTAWLAQLVEHGTFNSREDALEKGMATYSSILAWRTPWIEEPGGLRSWCHKESDTTLSLFQYLLHRTK